jgi:adenosylcobinamide-GDP ribazoletransferase
MLRWLSHLGQELALTVSFLTVLPTPAFAYSPNLLGAAGRWFPLVGVFIGLLLALVHYLLAAPAAPLLGAVAVVAAWAILTGALHLDGVADCSDGLLPPVTRARRLEIMRDPRVGTFGVVGVLFCLLFKVAAVAALPAPAFVLVLAPTWARWLLLLAARQPQARPDGMGTAFAQGLSRSAINAALFMPLAVWLVGGITPGSTLALLGAGLVAWLAVWFAKSRIGGVTGDVYGLVVELSETTLLVLYAASL